jgi:hypothetical protein
MEARHHQFSLTSKKGFEQIERSERHGFVFVNLKNLVDHEALATASPFPNPGSATFAVG